MARKATTVHRLKVTLRQIRPPVWRRIEVPSNMKLSELADVLESAMGWLGRGDQPQRSDVTYPVCVAGKRACPPDDCGGPTGYRNLLAALSDATHEEHEDVTKWAPPGFDADAFDLNEATEMMRSARPLRGW